MPKKKVATNVTKYKEGFIIPKNLLSKEENDNLLKSLTIVPLSSDYTNNTKKTDDPTYKIYREDNENYYVPKFWNTPEFRERFIQPTIGKNSAVNFNFKGALRGSQPEIIDHVLKYLETHNGGVLQLHTGYGKTTMAIYLASLLKLKTLVIVHKTFLQNQWYERIQQFTDASIGIIRQKKTDVEGRDIVIGMLQSISMIDYNPEIFKDFDLVIVDECHHVASKVFTNAFFKFNPKFILGLSATPRRGDGMIRVMHDLLGDVIVKVERKCNNIVHVKAFNYTCNDPLFMEKKKMYNGKLKPDIIKMTTNMCNVTIRNKFITNIVSTTRLIEGRKLLVLSKRIEHLKILKGMMDAIILDEVNKGLFDKDEYTTSFYIGGMKDWQLKAAEEADIIFATYSMAEEGLDINGLNTLILANSIKDPIQAVGRILRKILDENDIPPLIIDIGDKLSFFQKWFDDRIAYYKKNKYIITPINVVEDVCVSIHDYLVTNKIIKDGDQYDLETLREKYIIHKFGKPTYDFEKRGKFRNYPNNMFDKFDNFNKIFEIENKEFDPNDQGSIIDYNPITHK